MKTSQQKVLTEAVNKALSVAKVDVLGRDDCTFFATVCLSMQHIWDNDCDTAWTNGRLCAYNPDFFWGLVADVRASVVFHEVGHVWLDHAGRCGDRNPLWWNWAGDQVINNIAKAIGFVIPDDWLCDARFIGMSTEQIYDVYEQEQQNQPQPQQGAFGEVGSTAIGPDLKKPATPEEAAAIKAELDMILVQAAMQSKMAGDTPGSVPGDVQRYVDELLKPKIPWHRLMVAYARKFDKGVYTFSKLNRRYFPDHMMPSSREEKMDRCAFIVDSSGSVTDDEFNHMVSETACFMKTLRPETVDFIQFDTQIKTNDPLKSVKDLQKVNFTGKGGTQIAPVLKWIIENKPVVAVIFTDGYFHFPTLKPKTPILWIIHGNPTWTAPFGKVIHFEFDPQ